MEHQVSTSRTPVWNILIPVKGLDAAKSRLAGSVGTELVGTASDDQPALSNADLALAFAQDVVAAAVTCSEVASTFVVTRDKTVAGVVTELGANVIVEPESWAAEPKYTTLSPLNAAVQFGADQLMTDEVGARLAIITGDLPCLDSTALTEVLTLAAAYDRSFIPDHTGLGTAMLCIKDPGATQIDPRFGIESASAHETSGAVRIKTAPLRARLDVDTAADLENAQKLGVGIETAMVLESLNPSTIAE